MNLPDLRLSTREEGKLPYRPAPSELKGLILDEETCKFKDWSSSGRLLGCLAVHNCSVICHRKGAPMESKRGNERERERKKITSASTVARAKQVTPVGVDHPSEYTVS